MRLYSLILSWAVFAIILSSCDRKNEFKSTIVDTASLTNVGMTKLSELVESINIVPLETNDSILIGQIDAIKVRESGIYVLSAKIIYHFDSAGSYVGQLNLVGPAPGEVQYLTDFDVADGYCYIMATDKIVIRSLKDPGDFREISPLHSGGKIRNINEGIIASFDAPLPNGNSVMLFAESGDTICSLVSVADYQSTTKSPDFIEYEEGKYLHYTKGNDLDIIVPADKRSYKMTFVENEDAVSTEELSKAKKRSDFDGEIMVGMAHSKSHYLLLSIKKDKIYFYLYDRNTGLTRKFDSTIEDDISGAEDIQQNIMLGMLAFNESDNDNFVSVIDPNATYKYIADNPNKFAEAYKPLEGLTEDANPAVIFIKFK